MNMTDKYSVVGMKRELQRDTIKRYSKRRMRGVKSRDITPENRKIRPMIVGKGKRGRDITPEIMTRNRSEKEHISEEKE
jgi:hypothetical protein